MEKIIRNFEVNYSLYWRDIIEISRIKKDIEELEKLGATHIEIDIEYHYDDSSIKTNALSKRLETDNEFKQRIEEEIKRKEAIKRRDLEQLEIIKAKYGI